MSKKRTYSRKQLAEKASLTDRDLVQINRCRRPHNRLGFGYQVGFVRLLNRFPSQLPFEVIDELVVYTGVQLHIDPECITQYEQRRETIAEHQDRIRSHLDLKPLGPEETKQLEAYLYNECFRIEQTASLIAKSEDFLKANKILCPAESTLTRIIGEQRARARESIYTRILENLPSNLSQVLDDLLIFDSKERFSKLQKIKANPKSASPEAMVSLTDKMSTIEATGVLNVDLSWLSRNYQRALYHYVRSCSVDRLRDVSELRRHACLTCFLWQSYRDAVDQAVDMFDKILTRIQTKSKKELDERIKRQRKSVRDHLVAFSSLGKVALDAAEDVEAAELLQDLFKAVPREKLKEHLQDIAEWVDGKSSHVFHGVLSRYSTLRKFSPTLIRAIDFLADTDRSKSSCLNALDTLKQLNEENKRKLPDDVSCQFVPSGLRQIVEPNGKPDRRGWECALLVKVRDEIRSGNISVKHSKRFGKFDDFFMDADRWVSLRTDFFERASLPRDASQVSEYLRTRLNSAYDNFLEFAPDNSFAKADENGWHLSTDAGESLDEETEQKVETLRSWLSKNMRKIRLPELLIEVDNDLRYTKHFMTPSQRQDHKADDIYVILASIMAHGCNLGPYTMADLVSDASYRQIKRVSDWQMTEEAQRSALAELVRAIAGLDTSLTWGEGKTSASDGQRFLFPKRVIQQTYSPKFGDFALEFYSFVADNYAPFYSTPIECKNRDSGFVLDGLLYNESELQLEEHYTDTHGYTEINFAAFAMLGRRFCPRIRGVKHQRIYRIDKDHDYGALTNLVNARDRTIKTEYIADQWGRMGHFYASLECGHTAASVALRRLAGYSSTNKFYRANRDLGRVFKTEFILQYLSQPMLRRRIHRGTLKVEELHALARDVFYGKRGRISAREIQEQMNSCSCLTLILACIIYWQAKEISRLMTYGQPEANAVDPRVLQHISPIEWDNVVLYGQYDLKKRSIRP